MRMGWGIGVDSVEPARLRARVEGHPELLGELFTPAEQEYCRDQSDPYQALAGRFCAKEAVVKALRVDGWDPLEIEIDPGDPAPSVRLHSDVALHADALDVDVFLSLTHVPMLATAVAMAVPRSRSSELRTS